MSIVCGTVHHVTIETEEGTEFDMESIYAFETLEDTINRAIVLVQLAGYTPTTISHGTWNIRAK